MQLIVDGQPFMIIGGETGNSTASCLEYMEPLWDRFADMKINTILAPIYWDLIEPEEGRFDFRLVDGLIEQARSHDMRLVPLWFGSWKNSMSCYVPAWVKQDQARFPRADGRDGKGMEMLSAFSASNWEADARAFTALMAHIRAVDAGHHTVIMMQVENEIGMIPAARDHSPAADEAFHSAVPEQLLDYLTEHEETLSPEIQEAWSRNGRLRSGTWEEVFGKGHLTDELFMAWHYGAYVQRVAAPGRAEYDLPFYVNAALIRPGYPPGRYPSAGPLPHLIDVWRAAAPVIDFLAPDIYFSNATYWMRRYAVDGNPLFIPEARRTAQSAADAFYAIGEHAALGYSPFAIEAADPGQSPLTDAYRVLDQLEPLILAHQAKGTIRGVAPDVAYDGIVDDPTETVSLGGYVFNIAFEAYGTPHAPVEGELPEQAGGGLIISLGDDEFIVAGTGMIITFAIDGEDRATAGILDIQEGEYVDGQWQPGRWLNGDQSHQGRHVRLPMGRFGIQRVRLYRYE